MKGLEMLTARGVLTKINSVLIPGINDEHLIEVNREVKKRGAFLHNIMPLISEAEHGTVFGLTGQRGPSAQELKAVQDACMGGANLMRHCRQCRADAVGLLGEDRSDEFTLDKIDADGQSSTTSTSAAPTRRRWRPSARPSTRPRWPLAAPWTPA
jgi:nitrogen fixation protein NifB